MSSPTPTILIVEDDEGLRQCLAEVLEDNDYVVIPVPDSKLALAAAQSNPEIGLLVTDVRLTGLDGIDTLGLLRAHLPDLKSVVITGYASEDAPARAIREGANDYLYKPFSLDDFISVVSRVLEPPGSGRPPGRLVGRRRRAEPAHSAVVEKARARAFEALYVAIRSQRLTQTESLEVWQRIGVLEDRRAELDGPQSDRMIPPSVPPPGGDRMIPPSVPPPGGDRMIPPSVPPPGGDRMIPPSVPPPGGDLPQQLVEGYEHLCELLSSLERTPQALTLTSPSTREQKNRFAAIYRRVIEGVISAEQLKLTRTLKGPAPEALKESREVNQLYRLVWGSGPDSLAAQ